jgi:hypothetical protein
MPSFSTQRRRFYGIQVIQKAVKINDLWAVVFDVHLPNEAGHIEFTAMQTGWGGDVFLDPNLKAVR